MTMPAKILVGKIVGTQGLCGELRVQTYTESPEDFRDMNIGTGSPLRLKFVRRVPNSSVIIMKAAGVDNRDAADALRGTELFIDRGALPALLNDEYYQADLIGMRVIGIQHPNTVSEYRIPTVAAVHNFGAGDILELDNGGMVSFAGAKVDMGKREITVENQNGR
ncbi:MAG: ribosome maturation factor RimM [Alphaproteobacteria bacterium]|nr:ribosome maturation factor RimM [Alphaproteobacteria bacterium]MCL2758580.1 ribosome maturation factor RimM [Alphaproteobacteria bacterium]